MKTAIILFLACSLSAFAILSQEKNRTTMNANRDSSALTYLALGDSYTIGESVKPEENFPAQLVQLLRKNDIQISDPEIRAVTGWTTGNLISSLRQMPPKDKTYSLVTLLIGVNNQYQKRTIQEYEIEFSFLLHETIRFAGDKKKVLVISIPDYGVTPFAEGSDRAVISKEVADFNKAQKKICNAEQVTFINITKISRQGKKDADLQAYDGLHPSARQYGKWVDLILPAATEILSNKKPR